MGALVTVELAEDSPQHDLPWIITFAPLDGDDDWEPVVCGPYERAHALGLAQHLVADSDVMAVVEPILPATSLDEIRAEIDLAQSNALAAAAEENDDSLDSDVDLDAATAEHEAHVVADEPSPDEIRAGFARISVRLTGE